MNKIGFLQVVFIVLSFYALGVSAQDKKYITSTDRIGNLKAVQLIVQDAATGRCWTEIRKIKHKIQIGLEQNGIAVFSNQLDQTPYSATISFVVVAERAAIKNGPCFGYIQMLVTASPYYEQSIANSNITYTEFSISILYQEIYTAINSVNFNAAVRSAADYFVNDIVSKSLYAKRENPTISLINSAYTGIDSHKIIGE